MTEGYHQRLYCIKPDMQIAEALSDYDMAMPHAVNSIMIFPGRVALDIPSVQGARECQERWLG